MIESPVLQELLAERSHRVILRVLSARLGAVPPEIATALAAVQDEGKLEELADWAGRCPTLEAFRTRMIP